MAIIAIAVVAIFAVCVLIFNKIGRTESEISYIKNNELEYFNTKGELTLAVQHYIDSIAPTSDLRAHAIVDACEHYNVDIVFVLAQGEIESHFGTKGLASKTNSVWNVGAYDNMTLDKILGKYKYAHPNQSIDPYLKLITTRYLTKTVEEGLMDNYVDVNGKRFASDPNYEERLSFKYKQINANTQIDSLSKIMYRHKLRANR